MTATATVNQHAIAGLDIGEFEQALPGGQPDHGQRRSPLSPPWVEDDVDFTRDLGEVNALTPLDGLYSVGGAFTWRQHRQSIFDCLGNTASVDHLIGAKLVLAPGITGAHPRQQRDDEAGRP